MDEDEEVDMEEEDMDTSSSVESGTSRISFRIRVTPDPSKKQVSVLMLTPQWQFDDYGMATITRSLVQNLRMIDPEGTFIKIICAVLEDDGNISRKEREDALKLKVQLVGYSRPRGDSGEPELHWQDKSVANYYRDIALERDVDFVIGHAPYLTNGCLNLKDMFVKKGLSCKAILVIHKLQRSGNEEITEEQFSALCEADVVLCMEKSVIEELSRRILAPEQENTPDFKWYFPEFSTKLFEVKRDENRRSGSLREIYTMTKEKMNLRVNGLDFALAATSVVESYRKTHAPMTMTMLTEKMDERADWEKEFQDLRDGSTNVAFRCDVIRENEDLKFHMRKGDLFLLPFKVSSTLFGSEALSAIAAGVPVLVSRHSPMGSLLLEMNANSSVVAETDVDTWSHRITQKIADSDETQHKANKLRESLLLETNIPSTHLDFINIVTGKNFLEKFIKKENRRVLFENQFSVVTALLKS